MMLPKKYNSIIIFLFFIVSWNCRTAFASEDQNYINLAENYLNSISTLKANFMQIAQNGDIAEGTIYLSRPGFLRIDYDPPSPIQIIVDGNFLIYHDKLLKQVSYIDIDTTPAGILVRPSIKLNDDTIKVIKIDHQPGIINVTLTKTIDQGCITLTFTESPFQLRQWQVTDQQGQITTVSLFNSETGISFDKEFFYFKNPEFGNGPDISANDLLRISTNI
ncbi:MAG: outer membrane lipoprotein carrier protein LolA [Rhodospirillaceae bacterium]|jgi:outer membrane lipoprotein-sorting protein|nr:outer membrane lipoprotein carrier protein LolA [Rhodospirillaceae bacterium]